MSLNLLIVDANEVNRERLRAMLQAAGYAVVEAADYGEALKALERAEIHAILSDILMPNMDGFRLCYEARRNQPGKRLPFILFTFLSEAPWHAHLAARFGVDRILQRSASEAEVMKAIREVTS